MNCPLDDRNEWRMTEPSEHARRAAEKICNTLGHDATGGWENDIAEEIQYAANQITAELKADKERLDRLNAAVEVLRHRPRPVIYGWTVPGCSTKDVRAAIDTAFPPEQKEKE